MYPHNFVKRPQDFLFIMHMRTWITLSVIPWASFLSFHELNAFSVEVQQQN